MKKFIAILCTIAILTMAVLPAMAEQKGNNMQPPQAADRSGTPNGAPNGNPNGAPNANSNSNAPSGAPNGNPNGAPNANSNANAPTGTPDGDPNGMPGAGMEGTLKSLLEKGSISQSTYDAIMNYMKTYNGGNASGDSTTPPEKPEGDTTNSTTPPEKPEGDTTDSTTPPEKPEGENQNGMQPQSNQEMLQAMLKDGVITDAEYQIINEALSQETTQSSGENSAADSTENING